MIARLAVPVLLAVAASAAAAQAQEVVVLRVTPGAGVAASTYNPASFRIDNRSSRKIAALRIDLATALLPDLLFDPDGTAGDTVGKALSIDEGAVETWLRDHRLENRMAGGFRRLVLDFQDFGPGEAMAFSIDVDPASIRGASPPGPGEAGSVSGAEMTGATVTVTFDGGLRQVGRLMADPTDPGAALAMLDGHAAPAPVLRRVGTQLDIDGAPGAPVTIVQFEAAAFGGTQQPNSVIALQGWTVDLDARGHGRLDLPYAQSDYGQVVAAVGRAAGPWGTPSQPMPWPHGELMGEAPRQAVP